MSDTLLEAIRTDDAKEVGRVLESNPELKNTLNDPLPGYSFGQTALMAAAQRGNRDIIDVLLRAGADINQKSHWWAGPFHVLDGAAREPWLPAFLISRGARPEIHHLVQLGMTEEVGRLLTAHPDQIMARGGDGQMPLHFAQTVEMAEYLIDRGADIDARDIDHESTAAQYMVRDRQPIVRRLVSRGAQADVLMAAALGDLPLVTRLLDARPEAIRTRVTPRWFPKKDRRAGGTIYIWTLGGEKGLHEIAREFGHEDVLRELLPRTPPSLQLAVACESEDDALCEGLRRTGAAIDRDDEARLVAACSRNRTKPALMMLDAGWPAGAADEGVTALHWAAFHGNLLLVRALVERGAPRDVRDREHQGTPRGWAQYGAEHGGHGGAADYPAVLKVLS
jgi:ankyrin repeat protein